MIEIKCSKRQYERIVDALRTYHEDGACGLGKTYVSCPAVLGRSDLKCDQCVRKHMKRGSGRSDAK